MKLVFMGTPDFAVPILEALCEGHTVVAVYTQPPRAAGRGQKDRPSPVHVVAEAKNVPVHTPKSLKKPDIQKIFATHGAAAAVVAAYGLILPQAILDAPRLGCLNVHASLLPRWRGAAPIQRAIMAGDRETGITIMHMDAGLDTGAMYKQKAVPIDDTTTAGALHDALAALGAALICDVLVRLETDSLLPTPQPEDGVTYADKIDKTEAKLDFNPPAPQVLRHVHGLSPFPGAYVELNGERLKFLTAEIATADDPEADVQPGTILDDRFTIACSGGAIRPKTVQRAGKRPMDRDAFLRGYTLRPGTRLG